MPCPIHIVKAVRLLIAELPKAHQDRVMDSLNSGVRVTLPELASLVSVRRETVWRWVAKGQLPRPRKIGRRTNVWDYAEVAHLLR